MDVWVFIQESEGDERAVWVCDSRETAEVHARRWVAERWRTLRRTGAAPESLLEAFRELADEGHYGEVERHGVLTLADLPAPAPA